MKTSIKTLVEQYKKIIKKDYLSEEDRGLVETYIVAFARDVEDEFCKMQGYIKKEKQ